MSLEAKSEVIEHKRSYSESQISTENISSPSHRPKLNIGTGTKDNNKAENKVVIDTTTNNGKLQDRWYTHGKTEDYVNIVGELMYPKYNYGPYGFEHEKRRFPIDRMNTLGWLLSPLRKPCVFEKWSPIEVAVFEGSITLYGKNFNMIQKYIKTKTVQEVIEFYYDWKKTSHYKEWKKIYTPDQRETPIVYAD